MARKARVEYEGAVYHVLDRGDRREAIFKDDEDRRRFLDTLGEACARTGWRVHAYVLMGNHYHWMIETPQANLAQFLILPASGQGKRLRLRLRLRKKTRPPHHP